MSFSCQKVVFSELDQKDVSDMKRVFLGAFRKAYQGVSSEELGIENKEVFLLQAFEEEIDLLKEENRQCVLCRSDDNTIIGFLTYQFKEDLNEVYGSQLAVHPDFQEQGVAKAIVSKFLEEEKSFDSETLLTLVTRKVNSVIEIYKAKGLVERDLPEDSGYDPDKYIGMSAPISKLSALFLKSEISKGPRR